MNHPSPCLSHPPRGPHRALLLLALFTGLAGLAGLAVTAEEAHDLVIYGGTSGGVIAAVQAAEMGHSVVLIEPGRHVGGMSASGLGQTDVGYDRATVGGKAAELYRRANQYYENPAHWTSETREAYLQRKGFKPTKGMMLHFEPHVMEQLFTDWLRTTPRVQVVFGERLDLKNGVLKEGARITGLKMESGRVFPGKMFLDASYEGDLLPGAGVTWTAGRESRAQYGERFAGVQRKFVVEHQFRYPVDPFVKPGDPASGLLPEMHAAHALATGEEGSGDRLIQSFTFRLCLTDDPANLVPFTKPATYDPQRFELLARYFAAGFEQPLGLNDGMPNRKTDLNNFGPFSVDYLRGNDGYVEGDYVARSRIVAGHERYQREWLWFLGHDERVPQRIRDELARWGLPKDEFTDHEHWPWQLYVRESRRMVGDYVMTEADVRGTRRTPDSIALGDYPFDAHNYQRYVDDDGHARVEGGIDPGGTNPYPISYRSIVPRQAECENLVVPWSLSASHVAFLSIRMEPVFMMLSQAGATAACLALETGLPLQKVDYAALRARLLADGLMLDYPLKRPLPDPVDPATLPGIVVDDLDSPYTEDWNCHIGGRYVGDSVRTDEAHGKGIKHFRFTAHLPQAGRYEVRFAYLNTRSTDRAVPVTVHAADGPQEVIVNESLPPPIDRLWISLGTFAFGTEPAVVEVSNIGTKGTVIVDAVQFLPQPDAAK
ncbi:MAG: FAD-dependent oxidoreductase [Chthoniobacter sp.]